MKDAWNGAISAGVTKLARGRLDTVVKERLAIFKARLWMGQQTGDEPKSWYGLAWWAQYKALEEMERRIGNKSQKEQVQMQPTIMEQFP